MFRGYRLAPDSAPAAGRVRGAARAAARAVARSRPAAAATPTRCIAARLRLRCCSRTGPRPTTRRRRASPRRRSCEMLAVCEAIVEEAARGAGREARGSRRRVLKLRRGVVVATDPLTVRVGDEERPAWADAALVGEVREGDEVIVNVEALDLGLGSGGFDVVHVNLTRGLERPAGPTSARDEAQLHLAPAPRRAGRGPPRTSRGAAMPARIPVLVLPAARAPRAGRLGGGAGPRPGLRLGYVQTPGGALPGRALARRRRAARARPALRPRHRRAGLRRRARGDQRRRGARRRGGSRSAGTRSIAGPGPGILGSATRLGHGGMAALDSAHAALALGLPTLLAPRLSGGDPRPRHRGLSHHSETVLELLLGAGAGAGARGRREGWPTGERSGEAGCRASSTRCTRPAAIATTSAVAPVDLDDYAASGLPTTDDGPRRSPRTGSSSPLRSPPATRWAPWPGKIG